MFCVSPGACGGIGIGIGPAPGMLMVSGTGSTRRASTGTDLLRRMRFPMDTILTCQCRQVFSKSKPVQKPGGVKRLAAMVLFTNLPTTKFQHLNEHRRPLELGYWVLVIDWDLGLGHWDFKTRLKEPSWTPQLKRACVPKTFSDASSSALHVSPFL